MWPFRKKNRPDKSTNKENGQSYLAFADLILELQKLASDDKSADGYACSLTLGKLEKDMYNDIGPESSRMAHDLIPALLPIIQSDALHTYHRNFIRTLTNLIAFCKRHKERWNTPLLETVLRERLATILGEIKDWPSVGCSLRARTVGFICCILDVLPELNEDTISTLQMLKACKPLQNYMGPDYGPHIQACFDKYVIMDSQLESQIATLEQYGGTAAIGDGSHGQSVISLDFSGQGEGFGTSHLEFLASLTELRKLDISSCLVPDDGLSFLKGLHRLQDLNLHGCYVTDDGLRHLADLACLRMLNLSGNDITDAGLQRLVKIGELWHLNLGHTKITRNGLRSLAALRHLKGLELEWFTQPGLEALKHIPSLEALMLDWTSVSDAELRELSGLKNLKYLNVNHGEISDSGLLEIAKLANLQVLSANYIQRGGSITEAGLRGFKDLPCLFDIDLSYTASVTDAGLEWLSQSRSLKTIRIRGAAISASGLDALASLESLRLLDLGDARRLADECLNSLQQFTQLEDLELSGTKISESGYRDLQKALPDCHISWAPILV